MSKHLYVSTDESEAKYIIGYLNPKQYAYHDIDMHHGDDLKKTLGFNPMGVIEFNDNLPDSAIDALIAKFAKENLVAVNPKDSSYQKPEIFEEIRK